MEIENQLTDEQKRQQFRRLLGAKKTSDIEIIWHECHKELSKRLRREIEINVEYEALKEQLNKKESENKK